MAKIITVSVYRNDNNDAYPGAKVTVGGHSSLDTTTIAIALLNRFQ